MNDYDHLFKILLVGDSGVGKSSLLLRFVDDMFSETFISTIGVDFKIRTMKIHDKVIKLQIWDTAGQERFRTITSAYYRGAHGIILVYDVADQTTFDNAKLWLGEIDKYAIENAVKLLLGNKMDMEERRVVSTSTGRAFSETYGIQFMEASAKNSKGVNEVFTTLVQSIYEKRIREISSPQKLSEAINIADASSPVASSRRGCCS